MTLLGDVVALLASLGTAAGDRVYQDQLPQGGAYPAIVVSLVANPGAINLEGAAGHATARLQFDCWGDGYASKPTVRGISAAINSALHGFRGMIGGTTVLVAQRDNEIDLSEADGDSVRMRVTTDFLFTYLET